MFKGLDRDLKSLQRTLAKVKPAIEKSTSLAEQMVSTIEGIEDEDRRQLMSLFNEAKINGNVDELEPKINKIVNKYAKREKESASKRKREIDDFLKENRSENDKNNKKGD